MTTKKKDKSFKKMNEEDLRNKHPEFYDFLKINHPDVLAIIFNPIEIDD